MNSNLASDVEVAQAVGYDGLEIWLPKLKRYLAAGFTTADLASSLSGLRVTMIDVLLPIERSDPEFRKDLLAECESVSVIAAELGCQALQVVALREFGDNGWPSRRKALVSSLTELAERAEPHGVRLALEPVTFSPFRSIPEALEVVEAVGPERVGLVLDTWHLWTSGVPWDRVAGVDPELVVCAHISDTNPKTGSEWSDEDRAVLPGDGILPLDGAIAAIRQTGYDGTWSVEMFSEHHAEWEPHRLARQLLRRARDLLAVPQLAGEAADTAER